MSLKDLIDKDFIESYKAKDEAKVSILRMVKSALKNAEIEQKKPLEEADIIKVLKKEAKQRQDSAAQYEQGGRPELAKKEQDELNIIKSYLPKELSEEELNALVETSISESGAQEMKDMGKVISLVMQKTGGAADGAAVASIVRSKLSK